MTLFLLTVLVVLAVSFVVFALVDLIAGDGIDHPRRTPPRSHPADTFEPHRFA